MDSSQSACPAPLTSTVYAPQPAVEPRRTVTASQVANAIVQLRERSGPERCHTDASSCFGCASASPLSPTQ